MPLPAAAGVAQATMRFRFANGAEGANVYHVKRRAGASWSHAELVDLATLFNSWWELGAGLGVNLQAYTSDEVTLLDTVATDLASSTGPQAIVNAGAVGDNVNDPMPAQIAVVATWRTALRGRSTRGRTYWGGFTEGLSDPTGIINSGDIAAFVDIGEDLLTRLAAGTPASDLVVLSYFTAGAPRATPLATVVTDVTVDPFFDTQRRRARP